MILVTEKEVIEGFKSLRPEAQKRVREAILMIEKPEFDIKQWLSDWDKISERIANEEGTDKSITSLDLLREVRGE